MMASKVRRITFTAIYWLVMLLGASALGSGVFAQQKPISIESSSMQPSVVVGRPILTWWDVKIPGSGLMVGKFRFQIHSEGYQFATLETEELTLNGPEQRIRVLLPTIDCPDLIDRLYVDVSFQGSKFSGELGQHILRVPFATKCVFIALVGESRITRRRSPQRDNLLEQIKFENLVPKVSGVLVENDASDHVQTIFASIDPVDFPSEPLAYCGYDLVILMKDEFRNLRKPQLDGLLAWVQAGGSLYLEPNGVLEAYHLEFLRSLTRDDPEGLVFQLDSAGKVPPETVPPDRVAIAIKCGLGDVVVRTEDPEQPVNLSPIAWRSIAGPLWKWRTNPVARPTVFGQMVGNDGQPVQVSRPNSDPWGLSMAMLTRHTLNSSELLDRLMPDGVRMVPLSLLALILLVFVLMIGPGDYFVLGWLRARKLTWLTFPLTTLGVTALTVLISNSYMSTSETRRALILHDLGPRGDIVRSNRFELLFMASTHQEATETEKSLLTPLKTDSTFGINGGTPPGFTYITQNGQLVVKPAGMRGGSVNTATRPSSTLTQGRIPTQSTTLQDLSKWTPQLNRITSLSNLATAPQIDWTEFDLKAADSQTIAAHAVPPVLLERVHARFGKDALVSCFTGADGWASDRAMGWRSTRSIPAPELHTFYPLQAQSNGYSQSMLQLIYEADLLRWIYQASVLPPNPGILSLTRQTSPKGGAACDDLPLLDATDPRAWLLVVIVPGDNEYVAYRKLMRFVD